jgi:RNA polymerase sigma-70 factor (ECF subfamily)
MTLFSGDEEAALDGVSHAFTQALVNKLMLETMPEPAMKAWLYAAARNAVVDIKRRETRFYRFTGENGGCEFADPRSDDPLGKAIAELLIEKLPESLRVPVELKYYGGMNASEIGEVINVPAATVRTRLRAALRQLRKQE